MIESDVNILDIAALAVIVEAAGGRFTDLDGKAPDLDTTYSARDATAVCTTVVIGELA